MEKFGVFGSIFISLLTVCVDQGNCIRIVSQPMLERPESLIDLTLKTQYAVVGSSYKMKCKVDGEAIILWKVDGGFPDEPKYKILPDFNLLIRNVSLEDFKREYICSAVVPKFMTVESMRIELEPRREGKALNQPSGTSDDHKSTAIFAVVGELKTLTCSVTARPYPEFKWLYANETLIKNGTDVMISSEEDTSNLTVFLRNADSYGSYLCEAWNTKGRTKLSFSLMMPEKPKEIPFIYPKTIGQSKITLGVTFDKSKNFSVQVQYKPLSDEEWEEESFGVSEDVLTLRNLQPNTTYLIQAAVKSKFILGDYSEAIRVTTDKLPNEVVPFGRGLEKGADGNRIGRGRSMENQELQEGEVKVINSTVWTSTKMVKLGQKVLITRTTVEEMDDDV